MVAPPIVHVHSQIDYGYMPAEPDSAPGWPAEAARQPDALAEPPAVSNRFKVQLSSGYVADPAEKISIVSARCRSWLCPTCGPWLGRTLRHQLLCQSASWIEPIMITFTCGRSNDPWNHATPLDAYHHVMRKRYIARMMMRLGIKRWVAILEPQGDGFPHWHLLADAEGRRLDYLTLRRLWRKWKIGEQVEVTRNWSSASKAINYITKYLIKRTDKYPPWMYATKRLRVVQGSRAVGPLTGDGRGRSQSKKAISDELAIPSRIPAIRVAQCGGTLIHVERDPDTLHVISVERVPMIPDQRVLDLSGVEIETCPFTGARTRSIDREKWGLLATAWKSEFLRDKYDNWWRGRMNEFLGIETSQVIKEKAA